jgi:hypothetical protein
MRWGLKEHALVATKSEDVSTSPHLRISAVFASCELDMERRTLAD